MSDAKVEIQETDTCVKLKVTSKKTGREIFHAEIFSWGDGGDIDVFCPADERMKVMEWVDGVPTLSHVSPVRHVAVDVREE